MGSMAAVDLTGTLPRRVQFPLKTQAGFRRAAPAEARGHRASLPRPGIRTRGAGTKLAPSQSRGLGGQGMTVSLRAEPEEPAAPGAIPGPGGRQAGGGPASLLPKFVAVARLLALPAGLTPRARRSAGSQLRAEGGGKT